MATPTIKSTYSLDVETVRTLEALAQRWNVSKSRALQRSIQAAAEQQPPTDREALDALNRLQSSLSLDETTARDWEQATIAARLFNESGRQRGTFIDCMIAATALSEDALIATPNVSDFRRFESLGLKMAPY